MSTASRVKTLNAVDLRGHLMMMERAAEDSRNLTPGQVPVWTISHRLVLQGAITGDDAILLPGWTISRHGEEGDVAIFRIACSKTGVRASVRVVRPHSLHGSTMSVDFD